MSVFGVSFFFTEHLQMNVSFNMSVRTDTHLLFFSEGVPVLPSSGERGLGVRLTVVLTKQLLNGLDVDVVLLLHSALSPQVGPSLHL